MTDSTKKRKLAELRAALNRVYTPQVNETCEAFRLGGQVLEEALHRQREISKELRNELQELRKRVATAEAELRKEKNAAAELRKEKNAAAEETAETTAADVQRGQRALNKLWQSLLTTLHEEIDEIANEEIDDKTRGRHLANTISQFPFHIAENNVEWASGLIGKAKFAIEIAGIDDMQHWDDDIDFTCFHDRFSTFIDDFCERVEKL